MTIMRIKITDEMKKQAAIEANKRDPYIRHHFEVPHLTSAERDMIGFLGEFACCEALNIDWRKNIREDYLKKDSGDLILNGKCFDVKTETVPSYYAKKIVYRTIGDNEKYGCRLIHQDQFPLLLQYDFVTFGLFFRESLDFWYPIGYLETAPIVKNYPPTNKRPDGEAYPFPGSPVPTSLLRPFHELLT